MNYIEISKVHLKIISNKTSEQTVEEAQIYILVRISDLVYIN